MSQLAPMMRFGLIRMLLIFLSNSLVLVVATSFEVKIGWNKGLVDSLCSYSGELFVKRSILVVQEFSPILSLMNVQSLQAIHNLHHVRIRYMNSSSESQNPLHFVRHTFIFGSIFNPHLTGLSLSLFLCIIQNATTRVWIHVTKIDFRSSDMFALCYACGYYVPQSDIGSHDKVCPATEEEKKKVMPG